VIASLFTKLRDFSGWMMSSADAVKGIELQKRGASHLGCCFAASSPGGQALDQCSSPRSC
jgi:hypothetical protein